MVSIILAGKVSQLVKIGCVFYLLWCLTIESLLLLQLKVKKFEAFLLLVVDVAVEHMLWHSFQVIDALFLLTPVACLSALEVVVIALAALPSTGWELANTLLLLFGLLLVVHVLFASIAIFATFKVVVQALVAVPAAFWVLECLFL